MGLISDEEKQRRRESVESVLGTNAMEGMFVDAATLALMNQFADGEIEIEEFSMAIDRHVQSMTMSVQPVRTAERPAVDAA